MRCVRAVCDCGWAVDALTDTQVSHHHTLVYDHFNLIVVPDMSRYSAKKQARSPKTVSNNLNFSQLILKSHLTTSCELKVYN